VAESITQPNQIKKFHAFINSCIIIQACKNHWQGYIFQGRHDLDNVKSLKYITNFTAPQPGQFVGIQLGNIDLIDEHFAGGRLVQSPDHIKKGTLAGPGWPHDGNVIAFNDLKIDTFESLDINLAEFKYFGNIRNSNDTAGLCHGRSPLSFHSNERSSRKAGREDHSAQFLRSV